jgi:hypothetical protein
MIGRSLALPGSRCAQSADPLGDLDHVLSIASLACAMASLTSGKTPSCCHSHKRS